MFFLLRRRTAFTVRCELNFLYIIPVAFRHFKTRAMAQAVGRWSIRAEAWVRSQVSLDEICGGQSVTGTGFSPSTSAYPASIIPPVVHIHLHQDNKQSKPGSLPKSTAFPEIG